MTSISRYLVFVLVFSFFQVLCPPKSQGRVGLEKLTISSVAKASNGTLYVLSTYNDATQGLNTTVPVLQIYDKDGTLKSTIKLSNLNFLSQTKPIVVLDHFDNVYVVGQSMLVGDGKDYFRNQFNHSVFAAKFNPKGMPAVNYGIAGVACIGITNVETMELQAATVDSEGRVAFSGKALADTKLASLLGSSNYLYVSRVSKKGWSDTKFGHDSNGLRRINEATRRTFSDRRPNIFNIDSIVPTPSNELVLGMSFVESNQGSKFIGFESSAVKVLENGKTVHRLTLTNPSVQFDLSRINPLNAFGEQRYSTFVTPDGESIYIVVEGTRGRANIRRFSVSDAKLDNEFGIRVLDQTFGLDPYIQAPGYSSESGSVVLVGRDLKNPTRLIVSEFTPDGKQKTQIIPNVVTSQTSLLGRCLNLLNMFQLLP